MVEYEKKSKLQYDLILGVETMKKLSLLSRKKKRFSLTT